MSGYFLKNPGSLLDYSFDWGFQLFEPGETIEGADTGWFYHPLTGRIVANGFDHGQLLFHNEPGYDTTILGW